MIYDSFHALVSLLAKQSPVHVIHVTAQLSEVRKMDLLGKVVFFVLFGYFVYRFTRSVERLYEGKIGTTINRIRCLNSHCVSDAGNSSVFSQYM